MCPNIIISSNRNWVYFLLWKWYYYFSKNVSKHPIRNFSFGKTRYSVDQNHRYYLRKPSVQFFSRMFELSCFIHSFSIVISPMRAVVNVEYSVVSLTSPIKWYPQTGIKCFSCSIETNQGN